MIRYRQAPVPALAAVTLAERRGDITAWVDPSLGPDEMMAALNAAFEELLADGGLVHLWRGEVVQLGGDRLRTMAIRYRQAPVPALAAVTLAERRGDITAWVDPSLGPDEMMAALNAAFEELLADGGLVHLWRGEVVQLGGDRLRTMV
ncbi:hypothetical protein [Actinacidiphila sp. ITFR-21]|uniref:hypothetical protein n=1 Tax=Actinacidiphila sp. ITFR-21 TaxID=3075199 RepID=UPI0028893D41|nr:hypothetical protein [Streptomyces sp. ITFR-21]WNI16653.1 hypothetical protein RLT57_14775 [Streptomyces sp. ITFR-21]